MGLSRRQFTKEFKLAAIQRLEMGASVAEVARAFEVNPNVLHRWRREFRQGPGNVFPGLGKRRWEEGRVAQLERKIGQQALVIDFLKGCLQRIDEQRKLQALNGKPLSTSRSKPKGRRVRRLTEGGRYAALFLMSFLRHGEIYRTMRAASPTLPGRPIDDRPDPHRLDEFPAGYSLAGCTPAEPASASPAGAHLAGKRLRCTM